MEPSAHPFTKFSFLVDIGNDWTDAAFTEVSAPDASVEVVEYRDGNSKELVKLKVPGLVSHGNVTLKYGLRSTVEFRTWVLQCVNDITRSTELYKDVTITLHDPNQGEEASKAWLLKDAWVTKYTATDMNATSSDLAFESVELAYNLLEFVGEGE